MYERILRNSISMMFWIAVLVLAVFLQVVLFSVSYLSFRIVCEIVGYRNIPLGIDKLIGWFFRAFLSEATVAHLFALALSAANTLGNFLFFYLLFDCLELLEDKRALRAASKEEDANALNRPVRMRLIIMAFVLLPLIPSYTTEVAGGRFRTISNVLGVEYPEEARKIDSWDKQMEENGDKMAWDFTRISIWGYLAVNILGGVISAFAVHKLSECWARLWDSFRRDPIPPGGGGGWPGVISQEETDENEEDHEESYETPDNAYDTTVDTGASDTEDVTQSDSSDPQDGSPDLNEMVDVIGSDERVTLAEAMSDPKYWIDPETHTVWDKEFRNQIMNEQSDEMEDK